MLRGECIAYLELFFAPYIQVYKKKLTTFKHFPSVNNYHMNISGGTSRISSSNYLSRATLKEKKEGFLASESTIDGDVLQRVWDEVDYMTDASRNRRDAY